MLAMRDNGQAHWDEHGAHLREQCVNVVDGLAEKDGIRVLDESWQTLDGQYTGAVKAQSLPITANKSFTSELLGFKGHYMIFPEGVINIRKLVGHQLDIINHPQKSPIMCGGWVSNVSARSSLFPKPL